VRFVLGNYLIVLKIEKWLAQELGKILELPLTKEANPYKIDMSSKNPRFTRNICFADQLDSLRQDTGE